MTVWWWVSLSVVLRYHFLLPASLFFLLRSVYLCTSALSSNPPGDRGKEKRGDDPRERRVTFTHLWNAAYEEAGFRPKPVLRQKCSVSHLFLIRPPVVQLQWLSLQQATTIAADFHDWSLAQLNFLVDPVIFRNSAGFAVKAAKLSFKFKTRF